MICFSASVHMFQCVIKQQTVGHLVSFPNELWDKTNKVITYIIWLINIFIISVHCLLVVVTAHLLLHSLVLSKLFPLVTVQPGLSELYGREYIISLHNQGVLIN